MICLGIETSCDETACGVVRDGREVLSNVVRSQAALHAPYGGIVPEIASRAHVEDILRVLRTALAEAGVTPAAIDVLAVTNRPGLIGSLIVGLMAAKALAFAWRKPLHAVDHLHAHIVAAALGTGQLRVPSVGLVVSGGHTSLLAVHDALTVRPLGGTTDDAAGEAFDKVAQILGLGYPGGPAIAAAARDGNPAAVPFARSLLGSRSLDFSFSGLKTAARYAVLGQQGRPPAAPVAAADVAASFQMAVVDTLVEKCARALDATGWTSLIVGGGVAANRVLRERLEALAAARGIALAVARPEFCTDNAAMVAALGCMLAAAGRPCADLTVDAAPDSRMP
ncbi:MAG TPA: tRNA (adenosine(37)-N6)-threonylcarbamoyltransferase complex transferase subunit TsaD [Planctomycetota bacterium]|nr:tRNA (adenosine(37)-N6)-threonylcarbamoyltransferase complex transferase subunit TsaD [Planctomycetota bacterium]OQC19466.1 MAG: tRNA N6-adenosine threonylcarbamoyltransferase [Planctomycetes bacterium ADurb.Bin069]NMD36046.1 tRNA (adenosine(37)-N6)-threonylcarbamoyltransferase complex transferase subunit TsaD [Planctomycetota bacterium]HNR99709.1 tRNA (adenosine(37)-N6)-threonylcarbamoyltransferase complex transferase subunit TsaD [Planctomycetota bacterium]HNU25328.1 tRNA (adenosine(37)-N6